MKTLRMLPLVAIGQGILGAAPALAGIVVSAPVDVIGNLPTSQFTGLGYGTKPYKDWGNEPFVAVNPTNPNDIVISSFAYKGLSLCVRCHKMLERRSRFVIEHITNLMTSGDADDRFSPLADRVPAPLPG